MVFVYISLYLIKLGAAIVTKQLNLIQVEIFSYSFSEQLKFPSLLYLHFVLIA
jgi:hypothetical protein